MKLNVYECQRCYYKWLSEAKSSCPNCNNPLSWEVANDFFDGLTLREIEEKMAGKEKMTSCTCERCEKSFSVEIDTEIPGNSVLVRCPYCCSENYVGYEYTKKSSGEVETLKKEIEQLKQQNAEKQKDYEMLYDCLTKISSQIDDCPF